MEKVYALIKNGIVENTIVAEASFIALIEGQYDSCVRIDELDVKPGIGWSYDGERFSAPGSD